MSRYMALSDRCPRFVRLALDYDFPAMLLVRHWEPLENIFTLVEQNPKIKASFRDIFSFIMLLCCALMDLEPPVVDFQIVCAASY